MNNRSNSKQNMNNKAKSNAKHDKDKSSKKNNCR